MVVRNDNSREVIDLNALYNHNTEIPEMISSRSTEGIFDSPGK